MKRPSIYVKMKVLGAIDVAPGETRQTRIHNVAQMTFTDEEGAPHQFTWRTIQTWYYRYKNHGSYTAGATDLIIRTADGVLRRCRNLCLPSMLEAVRSSSGTTMDIDLINRVLLQPHWQKEVDLTDF